MKNQKLLLMFLVLLMASCTKKDDKPNGIPIDSTIQISVREITSTGEIILDCMTERIYECYNFQISTNKQTGHNSIEISFEKIKGENICLTAFGPARTEINLGILAVGEYDLTLRTKDVQNKGRLKITTSQIIFDFGPLNGIAILTPTVQRQ